MIIVRVEVILRVRVKCSEVFRRLRRLSWLWGFLSFRVVCVRGIRVVMMVGVMMVSGISVVS